MTASWPLRPVYRFCFFDMTRPSPPRDLAFRPCEGKGPHPAGLPTVGAWQRLAGGEGASAVGKDAPQTGDRRRQPTPPPAKTVFATSPGKARPRKNRIDASA